MTHRHRVVQKAEIISAYYARRPFQRDISMLIVLHHLWVRPCSLPRRRSVGLTLSRDDDDDGDVEIKKIRGTIWTNPRTSQLQPKGRSLQYLSAKIKLIRLKSIESTFSTHETYKLRTHLSHQKCAKTHVWPFGIH